jgi:hypothetical protein
MKRDQRLQVNISNSVTVGSKEPLVAGKKALNSFDPASGVGVQPSFSQSDPAFEAVRTYKDLPSSTVNLIDRDVLEILIDLFAEISET